MSPLFEKGLRIVSKSHSILSRMFKNHNDDQISLKEKNRRVHRT